MYRQIMLNKTVTTKTETIFIAQGGLKRKLIAYDYISKIYDKSVNQKDKICRLIRLLYDEILNIKSV